MSPASSQDAYQAISVKAEILSDAEEKEFPHPITFLGIKTEPEVSCVSVSPPPSQSVHIPCSNHTESAVLLMLTFYP
jgi:uncharacterized Zn-finger protein